MVIYLYGKDSYRRARKLREIVLDYQARNATGAIGSFDFMEGNAIEAFLSATSSPSLFKSSTLHIIHNLFTSDIDHDGKARIKHRLQKIADDQKTFIVCSEESAPPRGYAFLTEPPARMQDFSLLSGAPFRSFLKEELRVVDSAISGRIINAAAAVFEPDLRSAVAVLAPLCFAGAGHADEEILEYANIRNTTDVMRIMFSIRKQPLHQRLFLLELLLSRGEDPTKLFHLLAYQNGCAEQCATHDISIKTGGLEYQEALTDLLLG